MHNASKQLGVKVVLHSTVSKDKGYDPKVFRPDVVTNHDMMDAASFSDLLCKSHFLLGMGDPMWGPTALEMLAHGGLYFGAANNRQYLGHPFERYLSQHPYLDGKPGVCLVDWYDTLPVPGGRQRCDPTKPHMRRSAEPPNPSCFTGTGRSPTAACCSVCSLRCATSHTPARTLHCGPSGSRTIASA